MRRWLLLLILTGLVVGWILDLRVNGLPGMFGDLFDVLAPGGTDRIVQPL